MSATDSVAAMMDLLRSNRELRRHIADAAIAAQLPPPTDTEFLLKCLKVKAARDQMLTERSK